MVKKTQAQPQTQTQQAMALFSQECVNASDAGFKMVAAGALAYIANHTAPKAEKADPKTITEDLKLTAQDAHKKTHANDLVNAAKRSASKLWGEKAFLATIAAEPDIQSAAVLVAAELKAIAAAHSPDGLASLRALFDALKPASKGEKKEKTPAERALAAIEKCDVLNGFTRDDLGKLKQAIAGLEQALAAQEAAEQVEQLADMTEARASAAA